MKSVLFVCLGNICRSPMAEAIFLHILKRENETASFRIDSAGLLDYHEGELADSRMRFHGSKRGYTLTHRSRPVIKSDFKEFDLIIGMDQQNIRGLTKMAGSEEERCKIKLMTDFCRTFDATHVPDPYYGGNQGFERVIDLLEDAFEGLYQELKMH